MKKSLVLGLVSVFAFAISAHAQVEIVNSVAGTYMDISGTGTALGLGDDSEVDFASTFLGTNIAIGNNGAVAIEAAGQANALFAGNGALPTAVGLFGEEEAHAVFWDDLDSELGDVYVQDLSDRLIVQWENRPHFPGTTATDGVTFQVQIFGREGTASAGDILAQYLYQDVIFAESGANDNGAGATIGYQTDTTTAAQWSFNTASVNNGDVLTVRLAAVPEPSTAALLGLGLLGFVGFRRRKR